jgi:hypothetical protein
MCIACVHHVQVQDLETAVKLTIGEIDDAKAALKAAHEPNDIDYHRTNLYQLRDKESALRDELKQLRNDLARACTAPIVFCFFSSVQLFEYDGIFLRIVFSLKTQPSWLPAKRRKPSNSPTPLPPRAANSTPSL